MDLPGPSPPALLPLRTLRLSQPKESPPTVCLARTGLLFSLIHSQPNPDDEYQAPVWATISVLVGADPFPGRSVEGFECFWMKTYSENEGLLDQLLAAGWVRDSGRKIKQGYVTLPMLEVRLHESEIAQQCPTCERYEQVTDTTRFKRCQACKKTYYCSAKCQTDDWPIHKKSCKDLAAGRYAEVENRRRRELAAVLGGAGFQTFDM